MYLNVITSYPKSGNTWLRFIIFELFFKEFTKDNSSMNIEIFIPDIHKIHSNKKIIFDQRLQGKKKFIKSHFEYQKFINSNIDKVILVIRNPLDILASLINYYNIKKENIDNAVNHFAKYHTFLSLKKDFNFPSWNKHIESWLNSGQDIITIRYSDLINDFDSTLKKVTHFFNIDIDKNRIQQIKQNTSFNSLLNLELKEKKENIDGLFKSNFRKSNFINKGKNNYYLEVFNSSQIEKLKESFSKDIKKYDL